MATNSTRTTKTGDELGAEDLAGTVRQHAEASVKDAQDLTAATVDHTREVVAAISSAAVDSAERGREIAAEALKAWTASAFRPVGNTALGWPDVREVVNASFDMASGVLDAQRQLAQRLVGAVASATPAAR